MNTVTTFMFKELSCDARCHESFLKILFDIISKKWSSRILINSAKKLFVYCGFGQVSKENGKVRLKVFIIYKDNISLREKEIWILLESLFLRLYFFSLCCYARVWEIESVRSNKCNESSCQNNTNTLNFFLFHNG